MPLSRPWTLWAVTRKAWAQDREKRAVCSAAFDIDPAALGTERTLYKPQSNIGGFDSRHYVLNAETSRYHSFYCPKFFLGSLSELGLQEQKGVYTERGSAYIHNDNRIFNGLEYFPVIRKDGYSIYLVDGHRWAFWAWNEALARGEISAPASLLHIDMHPDAHKIVYNNDLPLLLEALKRNPVVYESCTAAISNKNGVSSTLNDEIARKLKTVVADQGSTWLDAISGIATDSHFIDLAKITGLAGNVEWFVRTLDSFNTDSDPLFDFARDPRYWKTAGVNVSFFSDILLNPPVICDPNTRPIIDIDCDAGNFDKIIAVLGKMRENGLKPGVVTIALSPGEFANYSDTTSCRIDPPDEFIAGHYYGKLFDFLPGHADHSSEAYDARVSIIHFINMAKLAEEFILNW